MRGADCLSYKIHETMPPKRFKPTPTDAAKYDGQQEPRSWIDDYLQTVILHKGNQIAAMQCLQLYLKDSARAWLRGLPKGSIKSWDELVDAFVKKFQATYKRPVGIEGLRHCQQKPKESMRAYIRRFTKLLNAAEDVSIDRAIDAFSDGIRRESYIEELGRKKPKAITKLMEIANSWADGEDNVRKPDHAVTMKTTISRGTIRVVEETVRIAAKFGVKQEHVDFPSKSLALDVKEDERVRKSKKKPDDPTPKVSAVGPSAADSKASVDDSKDLALAASTSDGITGVTKATGSLDKIEDKKNPPLG
ncbi:hypothetical protein QYE76_037869 [Lolium multiflorum]|uniref:Retrotransposon gag domain-containing protein n=1 Tax=Lolium multiflorum TaxID=4521 RepID=A0AAD8T8H4_LOLMU|nr:hypothetical protein QYE76_037869 [Lolium multiflorum]